MLKFSLGACERAFSNILINLHPSKRLFKC